MKCVNLDVGTEDIFLESRKQLKEVHQTYYYYYLEN